MTVSGLFFDDTSEDELREEIEDRSKEDISPFPRSEGTRCHGVHSSFGVSGSSLFCLCL